jgi:hypothetical protein
MEAFVAATRALAEARSPADAPGSAVIEGPPDPV